MDPYVFAGAVIIITFAIGILLIKKIYDQRTHEPKIDIGNAIGLDLPDGVDINDALGGIFKR